jgi:hypothetical protein
VPTVSVMSLRGAARCFLILSAAGWIDSRRCSAILTKETLKGAEKPDAGRISTLPSMRGCGVSLGSIFHLWTHACGGYAWVADEEVAVWRACDPDEGRNMMFIHGGDCSRASSLRGALWNCSLGAAVSTAFQATVRRGWWVARADEISYADETGRSTVLGTRLVPARVVGTRSRCLLLLLGRAGRAEARRGEASRGEQRQRSAQCQADNWATEDSRRDGKRSVAR